MRLPHRLVPLAIALVLSGCSGSGPAGSRNEAGETFKPPGTALASPRFANPTISPDVHADEPDGHGSKSPSTDDHFQYGPGRPPSEAFRPPDVDGGGPGTLRLLARIQPGCVEQGGRLQVTLKTKPDVQVAFFTNVPSRTDGKVEWHEGRTDQNGLWGKTLTIPPELQERQYDLLASAADDKGYDGGHSGTWNFVVAERGECSP